METDVSENREKHDGNPYRPSPSASHLGEQNSQATPSALAWWIIVLGTVIASLIAFVVSCFGTGLFVMDGLGMAVGYGPSIVGLVIALAVGAIVVFFVVRLGMLIYKKHAQACLRRFEDDQNA